LYFGEEEPNIGLHRLGLIEVGTFKKGENQRVLQGSCPLSYDHFLYSIIFPDAICVSVELMFWKLAEVAEMIIDTLEERYFSQWKVFN
jgi:hypothetical protein